MNKERVIAKVKIKLSQSREDYLKSAVKDALERGLKGEKLIKTIGDRLKDLRISVDRGTIKDAIEKYKKDFKKIDQKELISRGKKLADDVFADIHDKVKDIYGRNLSNEEDRILMDSFEKELKKKL